MSEVKTLVHGELPAILDKKGKVLQPRKPYAYTVTTGAGDFINRFENAKYSHSGLSGNQRGGKVA